MTAMPVAVALKFTVHVCSSIIHKGTQKIWHSGAIIELAHLEAIVCFLPACDCHNHM